MKKFIIGMTAMTLAISLAGCGNAAQESSLNGISRQLDETSNTISSMTTSSPTSISIDGDESLKESSARTQESLLDEQNYRSAILTKTARIKNCLAKDIKLSKAEASALKDLTLNLEKYTDLAKNSNAEMNGCAKAISSLKKDVSKNKKRLEAKVNRLENNSNVRSAYYENILNTLEEIENLFGDCEDSAQTSSKETENTSNEDENDSDKNETQKPKRKLKRNIDTYRYADDPIPQNRPMRRRFVNQNYRFNPTRNTDTYGPQYRNIDNFAGYNGINQGFYPNRYGYANRPITPYNNYGSNNYNRLTSPIYDSVMPVSQEKQDEDVKKVENNDSLTENNPKIEENKPQKEENPRIEEFENDNEKIATVAAIKIRPEEDKIVRAH